MGKARLGIAVVSGALVVLVVFELGTRWGDRSPEEPDAERTPAPERFTLGGCNAADIQTLAREASLPNPAAADDSTERVWVRSSIGVPLQRVEWEANGLWHPETLREGRLVVPHAFRPARLKTAGHLAADVALDSREVVLEPHTSLVLTSLPVEHVVEFDPVGSWENLSTEVASELCVGAVDASTWAVAFDASELSALIPYLDMEVQLDDGTMAFVRHDLEPHRHDVSDWPRAPLVVEKSSLQVTIERAETSDDPVTVVVSSRAGDSGRHQDRAVLWNALTAWGNISIQGNIEEFRQVLREAGIAVTVELGPLLLGRHYGIRALDEVTGDHDRLFWVHDGSPIFLRLAAGLRLRAAIDVSPSLPLRELDRIRWSFTDESGADALWTRETIGIPLDEKGRFELALPDRIPGTALAAFPRPERLRVVLLARGFEPWERMLDTHGLREIDIGVASLVPLDPQLVLAPGHGLAGFRNGSVEVADANGVTLSFPLDSARELEDGALAIALERAADGQGVVCWGTKSRVWKSPPMLVLDCEDQGIAMRLANDRYTREPEQSCSLRIELDPARVSDTLRLGVLWEWFGIFHWIRSWPSSALELAKEVRFTAPADGARLWWVLGDDLRSAHLVGPLNQAGFVLRVP